MKKFLLSFSKKPFDRNKDKNYSSLEFVQGEVSMEDIQYLFTHNFCFTSIFNKTHFSIKEKTQKNCIGSQVLVLDLDSRKLTLKECWELLSQTDLIPSFGYTTSNNGIKKHDNEEYFNRYRICYVLDSILPKEKYSDILECLYNEVNQITNENSFDRSCLDISHFFCSSKKNIFLFDEEEYQYSIEFFEERYQDLIKENKEKNNNNGRGVKSINLLNNKKKRESNISQCDTFDTFYETLTDVEEKFLEDFNNEDFCYKNLEEKYRGLIPNLESSEIDYQGELYKELDETYIEIFRNRKFERDDQGKLHILNIRYKDGEGRRRKLYVNCLLRRLIKKDINFSQLLFALIYELNHFYCNREDPITKRDLVDIAESSLKANIENFVNRNPKLFKINKQYVKENNLNMKDGLPLRIYNEIRKRKNIERNEIIKGEYNKDLTIEENYQNFLELGLYDISKITYKRALKDKDVKKVDREFVKTTIQEIISSNPNIKNEELLQELENNDIKISKSTLLRYKKNLDLSQNKALSQPKKEKTSGNTKKKNKAVRSKINNIKEEFSMNYQEKIDLINQIRDKKRKEKEKNLIKIDIVKEETSKSENKGISEALSNQVEQLPIGIEKPSEIKEKQLKTEDFVDEDKPDQYGRFPNGDVLMYSQAHRWMMRDLMRNRKKYS